MGLHEVRRGGTRGGEGQLGGRTGYTPLEEEQRRNEGGGFPRQSDRYTARHSPSYNQT